VPISICTKGQPTRKASFGQPVSPVSGDGESQRAWRRQVWRGKKMESGVRELKNVTGQVEVVRCGERFVSVVEVETPGVGQGFVFLRPEENYLAARFAAGDLCRRLNNAALAQTTSGLGTGRALKAAV
jgi:hypothetical protein